MSGQCLCGSYSDPDIRETDSFLPLAPHLALPGSLPQLLSLQSPQLLAASFPGPESAQSDPGGDHPGDGHLAHLRRPGRLEPHLHQAPGGGRLLHGSLQDDLCYRGDRGDWKLPETKDQTSILHREVRTKQHQDRGYHEREGEEVQQ